MDAAGGGGYGDPFERDPESVYRDVLAGYVSIEGAKREYGVLINHGALDSDATRELRDTQKE